MTERKFTVIKGGASASTASSEKKFVSGFITDTRLMGVLGLYIHWELMNADSTSDFHQFFYFDAEEYGFETYRSLVGKDEEALEAMEQALIGGLGGNKVPVTEREATFLVQSYTAFNGKLSVAMPEPKSEYDFLLAEPMVLLDAEGETLLEKLFTPILSNYHLINYFLMRVFGADLEAAIHLTKGDMDLEAVTEKNGATLCKNTTDEFIEGDELSYLCESLLEIGGRYKLVLSELVLDGLKVSQFKVRSSFFVSAAEAAMMLNRPEFITVYEILADVDDFLDTFSEITSNSMQTVHDNGRLYVEFNNHNDHVNKKVFRLNDDIHGLYYVTDFGQLIIAAYGLSDIHHIEKQLKASNIDQHIFPTAKYEFKEPILYEFIQSDFDDFADFLDFLNS